MKNVLELLERTAARLPRQTAFADQQCSYDYQTVVNIAESVGSALAANGDRNCPVAVLMERGAPCLVTLMGCCTAATSMWCWIRKCPPSG